MTAPANPGPAGDEENLMSTPDGGLGATLEPPTVDDDLDRPGNRVRPEDPDGLDALFAEQYPDQVPATAGEARAEYLPRREYVAVRHKLVQNRDGEQRGALLGVLVGARQFRALLLYLLLLAGEPLLQHNRWLPLRTVAHMLTTASYGCTVGQARQAIAALVRLNLVVVRERGMSVELWPLLEDGSGQRWTPPTGEDEDPELQRYFAVPHALFTDEVLDRLHMPGLAVMLVCLKETSKTSVFSVPVDRFTAYYGFSERTAERGYGELVDAGLLRVHRQLIRDSRSARGLRGKFHRALLGPFSTQARRDAQRRAQEKRIGAAVKERSS
ncbi:hypothetical protein Ae168Ps1_6204 [Pseudonocardia sp. Ae168_Ps1]|nr:hypothetical protein Ae168Ps1_6204 [Pseudonocardia sp. Ae168_Ps1]OLL71576.1 hypothetical protein Ae263Ps1_6064 [Pseudonocardia sp. Ae263_Ps1]